MPALNEVPEVAKLLTTILTGEPVIHGALAVIPLLAPNLDGPTGQRWWKPGDRARVTEVSEAGSVPFLNVANGADRPLLLLDGEDLIGAEQNRILLGPPRLPVPPWRRLALVQKRDQRHPRHELSGQLRAWPRPAPLGQPHPRSTTAGRRSTPSQTAFIVLGLC